MEKNKQTLLLKSAWIGLKWSFLVLFFGLLVDLTSYALKNKEVANEQEVLFTCKAIALYCTVLSSAIFIDLFFFYPSLRDIGIVVFMIMFFSNVLVFACVVPEIDVKSLFYCCKWILAGIFLITFMLKSGLSYADSCNIKKN